MSVVPSACRSGYQPDSGHTVGPSWGPGDPGTEVSKSRLPIIYNLDSSYISMAHRKNAVFPKL